MDDPVNFVICGDGGLSTDWMYVGLLAYPDVCGNINKLCWEADWENCPESVDCGATTAFFEDPSLLKMRARHLAGVNIGFLDGHAAWWNSQMVLNESPRWKCGCWNWSGSNSLVYRQLQGIEPCGLTSAAGSPADGIPEGDTSNICYPVLY